jgi:hypothetical protein
MGFFSRLGGAFGGAMGAMGGGGRKPGGSVLGSLSPKGPRQMDSAPALTGGGGAPTRAPALTGPRRIASAFQRNRPMTGAR